MNETKAQEAINKIIETHRKSATNRQYPASKKWRAEAEELGILHLIPFAPYLGDIGNTEIQIILQAAKDDGKVTGGFNAYGEGDVVRQAASDLYKALNEEPEPEDEPEGDDTDGYEIEVFANHGADKPDMNEVSAVLNMAGIEHGMVDTSVYIKNHLQVADAVVTVNAAGYATDEDTFAGEEMARINALQTEVERIQHEIETTTLQIRLDASEKATIKDRAATLGKSVTDYLLDLAANDASFGRVERPAGAAGHRQ